MRLVHLLLEETGGSQALAEVCVDDVVVNLQELNLQAPPAGVRVSARCAFEGNATKIRNPKKLPQGRLPWKLVNLLDTGNLQALQYSTYPGEAEEPFVPLSRKLAWIFSKETEKPSFNCVNNSTGFGISIFPVQLKTDKPVTFFAEGGTSVLQGTSAGDIGFCEPENAATMKSWVDEHVPLPESATEGHASRLKAARDPLLIQMNKNWEKVLDDTALYRPTLTENGSVRLVQKRKGTQLEFYIVIEDGLPAWCCEQLSVLLEVVDKSMKSWADFFKKVAKVSVRRRRRMFDMLMDDVQGIQKPGKRVETRATPLVWSLCETVTNVLIFDKDLNTHQVVFTSDTFQLRNDQQGICKCDDGSYALVKKKIKTQDFKPLPWNLVPLRVKSLLDLNAFATLEEGVFQSVTERDYPGCAQPLTNRAIDFL